MCAVTSGSENTIGVFTNIFLTRQRYFATNSSKSGRVCFLTRGLPKLVAVRSLCRAEAQELCSRDVALNSSSLINYIVSMDVIYH